MKVVTFSLGCKVNRYESDSILEDFKKKGYEISNKLEMADIYVINTCAVTNEAEKKSRQLIARCKKLNKDAIIYVCGCASQKNPKQFEEKGVKLVKGVAGKQKIGNALNNQGIEIDELPLKYEQMTFSHQSRTRAYLKIQDGCDNFCTYCIIPYLRGRSRSRSIEDIINEAKSLDENVKEIFVVGINVSDYKINKQKALIQVLEQLDKFDKRIRLGSLEDGIIDEEFIQRLSKIKNFCPHFHMSLQSGSDGVLKRMNRHYSSKEFYNSIKLIRKYFNNAAITTDVIVGFPGETSEEFEETFNFIEKVEFSDLHIFQYSHRTGTVASRLADLDARIKKERASRLEKLAEALRLKFISKNQKLSILIEEFQDGYFIGHSKNFIKCYIDSTDVKVGDVFDVKIIKSLLDGVLVEKI